MSEEPIPEVVDDGPPRRVFLHIGLPKTGTTYLQDVMWANKDVLASHGFLLPGAHRRRHYLASLDVREDPKLSRRPGDVDHPWQDLVDEILAWDGDALVSHEFFGAASTEQVRRVVETLEGRDVHLIITARSVYDIGLTIWQETVKFGSAMPLDVYPVRPDYDPTNEWGWGSWDLAEILLRWGEVVPHERIHVLAVPGRSEEPAALWHRYAEILELDTADYEVPEVPSNTALGLVEVEVLRRVNDKLEGFTAAPDRGRWIRDYLAQGGILPLRHERFRAGQAKHEELMRRATKAVDTLASGGYDFRGDLDRLRPRPPVGLRHPDEVTDEEMLDSATTAIALMLSDVRKATRGREALRGRVAELEHEIEELKAQLLAARPVARKVASRARQRWRQRRTTRGSGE